MNIAEFAKELSHKLHSGQFRNDGKTPYTVHTDYVGDNAVKFWKEFNGDNNSINIVKAVGFLHDSAEDVLGVNGAETLIRYGVDEYNLDWLAVVDSVYRLSRFSKEQRIVDYLNIIMYDYVARSVKLADLEHNLSDLKPGNLRDKYHLCQAFLLAK